MIPLSRHTTVASVISEELSPHLITTTDGHIIEKVLAKSSFVQAVFNAVNVLVGVGILALPLSFRLAGWFYGSLIFLFCLLGTNYTAKIIVKCIIGDKKEGDDNNISYSNMGKIAFGDKGQYVISTIFIIELITMG